ncbi:hypothetical protein [Paenibacillus sp. YYML68]|uniref:hypothetical protein n=1 Tax=Paenibacillus sp. YYML68 TaxID=2909250 RepID=UPI002491B69D|nr:hypothetical protein [Paenibacillus sp. YYML68]
MKWNGRTIGGLALALLGICSVFVWGAFWALITYAFAFVLLFYGLKFWREANGMFQRICSGLGLLAGVLLLLYWLPKFIALILSAAMILGGLWLYRTGQSGGSSYYTFRMK